MTEFIQQQGKKIHMGTCHFALPGAPLQTVLFNCRGGNLLWCELNAVPLNR